MFINIAPFYSSDRFDHFDPETRHLKALLSFYLNEYLFLSSVDILQRVDQISFLFLKCFDVSLYGIMDGFLDRLYTFVEVLPHFLYFIDSDSEIKKGRGEGDVI
jgi:hypothetical protein